MQLFLDPLDLAPPFRKGDDQAISTHAVTFDKLTPEAQAAVRVVGRATFQSWDKQTYNAIYPPEEPQS